MGIIDNHTPSGAICLTLFFVLSGLLITSIITQDHRRGRWSFREFFLTRVVRLAPALMIVTAFVVVWWYADHRQGNVWGYVASAVFYLDDFFHPWTQHGPLGQTWSLAVEEQFYLIWPFLVAPILMLRRRPRWLVLAAVSVVSIAFRVGVAAGGYIDFAYANILGNAFALILGCALSLVSFELRSPMIRFIAIWGGIAALALMVMTSSRFPQPFITMPVPAAFVSAAVILGALGGSRTLELAPLRFLGRISYSVYLWHVPLLYFTGTFGAGWRAWPAVLLTFVLATTSTLTVEEPLRKAWRRRRASQRVSVLLAANA